MDDREIVRRCAEAAGWKFTWSDKHRYWHAIDPEYREYIVCEKWPMRDAYSGAKLPDPTPEDAIEECGYDPLTNDAQAMALVKRFPISIRKWTGTKQQRVEIVDGVTGEMRFYSDSPDLNRAICTAVANMQEAKGG